MNKKIFGSMHVVPSSVSIKIRSFEQQDYVQDFIGNGWIDGCMAVVQDSDLSSLSSASIAPKLLVLPWEIIHQPSGYRVASLMNSCLLRDVLPLTQICNLSITSRIYAAWLKNLEWGDPITQANVNKIKKKLTLEFK
jgi:hypothetical protein